MCSTELSFDGGLFIGRPCVSPSPVGPYPLTIEFLLPFLECVFPRRSVLSLDVLFGKDCKLEFMPLDSPRKMPSTRLIPAELSIGSPFINPLATVGWEEVSVEARCGGSYTEVSLESRWTGSLVYLERIEGIVFPDPSRIDLSKHAQSLGRGGLIEDRAGYSDREVRARIFFLSGSSIIDFALFLSCD